MAQETIITTENEMQFLTEAIETRENPGSEETYQHQSLIEKLRAEHPDIHEIIDAYSSTTDALRRFLTDKQKLFRRKDQLFRAVRALIDVNLHRGTLSLEGAATLLEEKAGLTPEVARSEVLNYAMCPTYAICYLVGKMEINRMRDKYIEDHSKGGLTEFHHELLQSGMIPLSLIERSMF
ncbi:MAG: DUF885 family protein [bacterium]|jgi:hypothetical protein|nr:DUF885 family protein [bacterium]